MGYCREQQVMQMAHGEDKKKNGDAELAIVSLMEVKERTGRRG